MLVEFSIIPLNGDSQISDEIAKVMKLVDASGLPYLLTPTGTCIEGDWDEVMTLIRQCHEHTSLVSPHLITIIKIEDEKGERNKIERNISSVEEKVGHPLKSLP